MEELLASDLGEGRVEGDHHAVAEGGKKEGAGKGTDRAAAGRGLSVDAVWEEVRELPRPAPEADAPIQAPADEVEA